MLGAESNADAYDTDESKNANQNLNSETQDCTPGPSRKRARLEFITPQLAAAFDRCQISDRSAVHVLLAAFLDTLSLDSNDSVINIEHPYVMHDRNIVKK